MNSNSKEEIKVYIAKAGLSLLSYYIWIKIQEKHETKMLFIGNERAEKRAAKKAAKAAHKLQRL